jgi:6-phosphogluconolactonase (cycloisomerase 2 family)
MGPGAAPTITGYALSPQGELTPIPGSTRPVSGGSLSGCTQVTFNPAGDVLVVTEKTADVISTYTVGKDGLASGPIRNDSSGVGPFGFTFTQTGRLLTSENFGGLALQGAAASYDVNRDGTLAPVSGSVRNNRSDTCWIVLTDDQRFAYTTNAMTNDISSYKADPDGNLTLLQSVAASAERRLRHPGRPHVEP